MAQLESGEEKQDLLDFVKALIAFRKSHPVFHMSKEPRLMDYLACGLPDMSYHGVRTWCPEFENFRRQLGVFYCGAYGKRQMGQRMRTSMPSLTCIGNLISSIFLV